MADGTWTTHPIVRRTTLWLAVGMVSAAAVLGALLWPLLVVIFRVLLVVVTHFWAALPYVVWLELAVLFSAALDWHEARIALRSWKHGWLLGHVTLWHRVWRRVQWVGSLVVGVRKQFGKELAPSEPSGRPAFSGVVIDQTTPAPSRAA